MLSVDVCGKMCDSNAAAGNNKSCYNSVVHQKLHFEAVRGRRENRERCMGGRGGNDRNREITVNLS